MSRLGDIFDLVGGGTPTTSKEEYWGSGTPWISSADIDNSGQIVYRRRVTPLGVENSTTNVVPKGTVIVVTRVGLGKVAQLKEDTCFSQDIQALLAKENTSEYSPSYLMYQLLFIMQTVKYSGRGTTISGITKKQLADVSLFLPPLPEQERIVAQIEELFSQLDAGVETLKKTKAQLAVYRQAVLKEAFSDCKNHVTIASITQHVTDGDHMPPPKADNGVPFIMISNIKGNAICWENTAFVDRNYYESIDSKRKPQIGDVLYTVTGSYGIPVLVDFDKEFCFQRHIALLRPKDTIEQKYLYYALMEPGVFAQATKGATGTAQKTVGLGVLRKIEIPIIHDRSEQMRKVENIESKLSVCDSIEQTVDAALQQAEALRQSILKDAFEGRL